jgi:SAM-dependent methyltransferase
MRKLSAFEDQSFDLIFHPVSNVFIPNILPVWKEAYRVLRPSGILMAGFMNPVYYLFGTQEEEQTALVVKFSIPYSDPESLTAEELQVCALDGIPLEFGHTLTDQIGGQLEAGLRLTGFYEDTMPESPLSKYTSIYIATRAIKPASES